MARMYSSSLSHCYPLLRPYFPLQNPLLNFIFSSSFSFPSSPLYFPFTSTPFCYENSLPISSVFHTILFSKFAGDYLLISEKQNVLLTYSWNKFILCLSTIATTLQNLKMILCWTFICWYILGICLVQYHWLITTWTRKTQ